MFSAFRAGRQLALRRVKVTWTLWFAYQHVIIPLYGFPAGWHTFRVSEAHQVRMDCRR